MKVWPKAYDGRAIIGKSYEDYTSGVEIDENIKRLAEAQASGDTSRNLTWAYVFLRKLGCPNYVLIHRSGTGVGLVNETLPAGRIVTEARESAKQRIRALQTLFDN